MDLIVGLVLFFAGVVVCLVSGVSLICALTFGLGVFFVLGLRRGFSPGALVKMALSEGKTILVVFRILALIGCLTGLWRASGTIAFFVDAGIRLITPHLFLLIALLLPALLSYAFGSCFGVTGTAGVVLMTIARSGQANLLLTAAAAMCGAYFGERCSPASSAGVLTAVTCGTDHREYQHMMLRTVPLPMLLTVAFFGAASWLFPIQTVDTTVLSALGEGFRLAWPTVIPAVLIIGLPCLKVKGSTAIIASCAAAFLVAVFTQEMTVGEALRAALLGYTAQHPALTGLLSGGGVISMASVIVIGFLSCANSGILNKTGMLDGVKEWLDRTADRVGIFPVQAGLSLLTVAVFCNQTVSIILMARLTKELYDKRGASDLEQAADLGSSVVVMAGLVPWAISASVPMTAMEASYLSLPLSVFLWLVPLCYQFTRRRWFPLRRAAQAGERG